MASPVRSRRSSIAGDDSDAVVEEQLTLSRRTSTSSLQQSLLEDQNRQRQEAAVEAMAQQSAAVQQLTVEQLQKFQHQQEEMMQRFTIYLQEQFQNQLQLKGDYDALRTQMEQQQQLMSEHNAMLRTASEKAGHQAQEIESLREAVQTPTSPRGQARWGWFARGQVDAAGDASMQEAGSRESSSGPHLTLAMGSNMPTPPLYRGSSRQEKKSFMDSYLVYERRIRALNEGSTEAGQLRLMPLSSCIEHKTLLRICDYELQRSEREVTEEMWKAYFLSARRSDTKDYARLAAAMKTLAMNTSLSDAESRVTRLIADFHSILDTQDMDDFPLEEPKLAVQYLCNALRPQALKSTIFLELKKTSNKPLKKSVTAFLNWLTPQVQSFCTFEAAIGAQQNSNQSGSNAKAGGSGGKPSTNSSAAHGGRLRGAAASDPAPPKSSPPSAAGTTSRPAGAATAGGDPPRKAKSAEERKCFKCGDPSHTVFHCPGVTKEEALELIKERRKHGVGAVSSPGPGEDAMQNKPVMPCEINGAVLGNLTLDTGTENSIVAASLVKRLNANSKWIATRSLDAPVEAEGFGGAKVTIAQEIKLSIAVDTPAGKLVLTNVVCWISPEDLPAGKGDILLSRPLMCKLGYDPAEILKHARMRNAIMDMEEISSSPGGMRHVMAISSAAASVEVTPEEIPLIEDEEQSGFPAVDLHRDLEADQQEVWQILLGKIKEAEAKGASAKFIKQLEVLLWENVDVFRLKLGNDPPVDVPPLEVTLKPDAVPVRCKARRYPPQHRDFMRRHVEELVAAGLCYRNPRSKWASPPLIVNKTGPDPFRMTVDVRAVNAQTVRILWPMPMLQVILDYLPDSKFYFLLDFFKGYWQFLLSLSSQELFSFLTDMGVFTPTRVLMGGTDSVAYCQATVQEMFADYLYKGLLIWLDDLLGYHSTEDGLFTLLKGVLKICKVKGLKLNPRKCSFFLVEARWCGRIISSAGVKHDPERIAALQALPIPATGKDLQQFVCALNWMRQSIPGFNKLVQPLVDLMELTYTHVGGRTRRAVAKVRLTDVGWNTTHQTCLNECKAALSRAVQLAHPDVSKRLCVFADASELHWGAVVTQVPHDHLTRDLTEQHHEPLMFLSGTFSGAAGRWTIVEKEAFAIVETCRRADYLLHRPGGFALYTDHRNLKFIFSPSSVMSSVPKYTADKLERWALLLMAYDYDIHDISGEANVWADLLSRWGCSATAICAIRQVPIAVSPQLDPGFEWPTIAEIVDVQKAAISTAGMPADIKLSTVAEDGVLRNDKGAMWIPQDAGQLQMRLCILSHFGAAGHRGLQTTRQELTKRFVWPGIEDDVTYFVHKCLHCASTSSGPPAPRPLGEALHAEKPNELLHWDFLYMSPAATGELYILVLKDDASKFVWLFPCSEATADVTYEALMDWFATFGICYSWVSDQGTHFKNDVIKSLQHGLGAHHHFTTARSPWANGTVEVVMRDTLRCFRALLSEWRMSAADWPRIAKVVQLALNNSPSPALGGLAPVTAMTGLPALNPLDAIAVPGPVEFSTLEQIRSVQRAYFSELQTALDTMHKAVAAANAKTRERGRKSKDAKDGAKMAQFAIGDFVLYADVWTSTRTKLSVRWRGPARVVGTTSNWIFLVENMITGDTREVHASRLKFYADASLNVTEELLQHVAHNSEGHVVDELRDARYNTQTKQYQLFVHWRGLGDLEDSWEPANTLYEDVPVLVKSYLRAHATETVVKRLTKALNIRL